VQVLVQVQVLEQEPVWVREEKEVYMEAMRVRSAPP
jgi:hypothetical protein